MAIKPILFSTPMVQAIKAGRKTQTRRIIKGLESRYVHVGTSNEMEIPRPAIKCDDRVWHMWNYPNSNAVSIIERCPVKAGDILWVRETWAELINGHNEKWIEYKADGNTGDWKWKPSIFMPKEAARIFLKVTNVRAERLQDISEDDAIAEGILRIKKAYGGGTAYYDYSGKQTPASYNFDSPIASFKPLWQSINGRESWEANPWVWVYEFEQIEKPKDFGNG